MYIISAQHCIYRTSTTAKLQCRGWYIPTISSHIYPNCALVCQYMRVTTTVNRSPESLYSHSMGSNIYSTTAPITCPHLFLLKKPGKTVCKSNNSAADGAVGDIMTIEQECEFCGEYRCIVGSPDVPYDIPDDKKHIAFPNSTNDSGINSHNSCSHLLFRNVYPSRCLRPCNRGFPLPVVSAVNDCKSDPTEGNCEGIANKEADSHFSQGDTNNLRIHDTVDLSVGDIPKPWLFSVLLKTLSRFVGDPNNPYEHQSCPPCSPLRYTPNPPVNTENQYGKQVTHQHQKDLLGNMNNSEKGAVKDGSNPLGANVKANGASNVNVEDFQESQGLGSSLFPSSSTILEMMKRNFDNTKSRNTDTDTSTPLSHSVESHFAPVSPFIPIGQWGDVIKYGIGQPYRVLAVNEAIGAVTRDAVLGVPIPNDSNVEGRDTSTLSQEEALIALDAIRYSAAAYGVPYEKGCFDEVKEVATIRATYDVYNASFESHFSATLRMLSWRSTDGNTAVRVDAPEGEGTKVDAGLGNGRSDPVFPIVDNEIILSKWCNYPLTPSFILSADHYQKRLVLTFRGTLNDFNTIADLMNEPIICGRENLIGDINADRKCKYNCQDGTSRGSKEANPPSERRILTSPRGFCAPVLFNSRNGCYVIKVLDVVLREAMLVSYPEYKLIVTGHSLGASLAQLYVMLRTPSGATGDVGNRPSFSIFQSNEDASPEGHISTNTCSDNFLFSTHEIAKRVEVHAFAPPPCVNKVWRDVFAGGDTSGGGSLPVVSSFIKMYTYVFEDDVVPRLQASSIRHYITALMSNPDDLGVVNEEKSGVVNSVGETKNSQKMPPLVNENMTTIPCPQKEPSTNKESERITTEDIVKSPQSNSRPNSSTDKESLSGEGYTTGAGATAGFFPFSYIYSLLSTFNGTEPFRFIISSWFNIDDVINVRGKGTDRDAIDKRNNQQLVINVCKEARSQMEFGLLNTTTTKDKSRSAEELPTDSKARVKNLKFSSLKETAANADSIYVIPGRIFLMSSPSSLKLSATKNLNNNLGCPPAPAAGEPFAPLHTIREIFYHADTLQIPRLDTKGLEDHFLFRYSSVLLQHLGLRRE